MQRILFWKERCLLAVSPEGGTTGQRAWSYRVVNEEIAQDRAPDVNTSARPVFQACVSQIACMSGPSIEQAIPGRLGFRRRLGARASSPRACTGRGQTTNMSAPNPKAFPLADAKRCPGVWLNPHSNALHVR